MDAHEIAYQIHLVPLRQDILQQYLALRVFENQETFVESPEESLRDLRAHAWHIDWTIECIYANDEMIGYAMHGMSRDGEAWLDRFMIDRRYQGHGWGSRALALLLEKMKAAYPDRTHLFLSVEEHNQAAVSMYKRFGFEMTSYMDGIYPVMVLNEAICR